MAIRMLADAGKRAGDPGVEEVTAYPGWNRETHGPMLMETTHVGLVLSTGEYNGYDDSDFFAEVWNPVTGAPERIIYATTRGWTYPNSATVDATPEVRAAYAAWVAKRDAERRAAREAAERKVVRKGKTVKVVRGRKVPKGTTGRVIWLGAGTWGERVGLVDAAGTAHWTALDNVEVVLDGEEAA